MAARNKPLALALTSLLALPLLAACGDNPPPSCEAQVTAPSVVTAGFVPMPVAPRPAPPAPRPARPPPRPAPAPAPAKPATPAKPLAPKPAAPPKSHHSGPIIVPWVLPWDDDDFEPCDDD